ncbi:hypothetical protein RHEC894_CH00941 [Rhizobium sp. CIAT894]|nr:hypothetical protein RHEC894_CH00941 [Rhizobium sp. CIAT894]
MREAIALPASPSNIESPKSTREAPPAEKAGRTTLNTDRAGGVANHFLFLRRDAECFALNG